MMLRIKSLKTNRKKKPGFAQPGGGPGAAGPREPRGAAAVLRRPRAAQRVPARCSGPPAALHWNGPRGAAGCFGGSLKLCF